MKKSTKQRKKAIRGLQGIYGRQEILDWLYAILCKGKQGFDSLMMQIGRTIAEAIMYIDREEVAGPDYMPIEQGVYKWASQPGSVKNLTISMRNTHR